jgi:hypothetical protein
MPKNYNLNNNYNHISMRADSVVELIKELSKLGVFKGKRKAKTTAKFEDETKQSSEGMRPQMRNLPPIQQIPQGATAEDIEDIQQQNALALAGLREDIQRGRVQDIQSLFSIPQHFRSQQEAGAGVFDPFERQSSSIDVQSGDFGKSTSEGAPRATPALPETTFTQSEEEEIGLMGEEDVPVAERLQPREEIKTGGGAAVARLEGETLRSAVLAKLGLGQKPPKSGDRGTSDDWNRYLNRLRLALDLGPVQGIAKKRAQAQVEELLKQREEELSSELERR